MVRIDEVNLQILKLLQGNGRMSHAELAQRVGRSESTVRERVAAMETAGLLQGYQARVDWGKAGLPAHAVIRARCDFDKVTAVAKAFAAMPHCTRALLLTGPKPILAILRVRDIQHLHSLLRESIAAAHLRDVEADIALESLVENRPPEPGPAGAAGTDLLLRTAGQDEAALGAPPRPAPPGPATGLLR
jgi:Lrp/AsnC family transcriptional regulator, leucine-responsive regulatory protein